MIRAIALLLLVASASVALSLIFGAEVLAALGLMLTQAKVVLGKVAALSGATLVNWLKAQGINFARVELGKRWFMRSLLPMVIGAATQRRIAAFVKTYMAHVKLRYALMMDWYRSRPRAMRIVLILIAMFATLALAVTSMSLWLLLFSVQLPIWIIAGVSAFGAMIWQTLQKMLFRTLAFMQLYSLWGFLRRRVPRAYLQRVRRFNFRIARIVVRRRRMTVAQLHAQKDSLAMRWELAREYFRHRRPDQPSAEEFRSMRERRD
ncbi:hypothetical protein [Oceanibium sediminis]|uniref:hypothetical protein n=1 Tax=Oceanibium sediminis TaxID=2026339 RepID=UPI000DD3E730|nr:hypothetical protein [Oceanibium sediminis]